MKVFLMRLKQQGYILLLTLVFIQILIVISMILLSSAGMQQKIFQLAFQYTELTNQFYSVLTQVEEKIIHDTPSCIIPITNSAAIKKQTESWWQSHACILPYKKQSFYFVIEKLADDPCALLNIERAITSRYYRIHLFAMIDADAKIGWLMQSTLVVASDQANACQVLPHKVQPGRQSVRFV